MSSANIVAYNVKLKRKEPMKVESKRTLKNGAVLYLGRGTESGMKLSKIGKRE